MNLQSKIDRALEVGFCSFILKIEQSNEQIELLQQLIDNQELDLVIETEVMDYAPFDVVVNLGGRK